MNIGALWTAILASEDTDDEPLLSVGSIVETPLLYYGSMAFFILVIIGGVYHILTRIGVLP